MCGGTAGARARCRSGLLEHSSAQSIPKEAPSVSSDSMYLSQNAPISQPAKTARSTMNYKAGRGLEETLLSSRHNSDIRCFVVVSRVGIDESPRTCSRFQKNICGRLTSSGSEEMGPSSLFTFFYLFLSSRSLASPWPVKLLKGADSSRLWVWLSSYCH